jgi:hypothetical protein
MYRRRRREPLFCLLFLLGLSATLGVAGLAAAPGDLRPARASSPTQITIRPAPLSNAGPEIRNPLRGLYIAAASGQTGRARTHGLPYGSYAWRDLEPAQGKYDFSPIARDLAAAQRAGRPYGFRVVAAASADGMLLPDYLAAQLERGRWLGGRYLPDWNDPDLLARAGALIDALGRRFAAEPQLGFVDIGIYGDRGGWSVAPADDQPAMSAATQRALVDRYLAAFPGRPLVLPLAAEETLVYAMQRSAQVGWRQTGLGSSQFGQGASMRRLRADSAAWALLSERWRSAPALAELSDPQILQSAESRRLALAQLREFHISLIAADAAPSADAALVELSAAAGYRYELREITMPTKVAPGGALAISTSWRNVGSAATYWPWQVVLQLREHASGALAWEGVSRLSLDQVQPAAPDAQQNDALSLPRSLASGSYDLVLLVRDPAAVYPPMSLAIAGRQDDGSYLLGQIELGPQSALQTRQSHVYLPLLIR